MRLVLALALICLVSAVRYPLPKKQRLCHTDQCNDAAPHHVASSGVAASSSPGDAASHQMASSGDAASSSVASSGDAASSSAASSSGGAASPRAASSSAASGASSASPAASSSDTELARLRQRVAVAQINWLNGMLNGLINLLNGLRHQHAQVILPGGQTGDADTRIPQTPPSPTGLWAPQEGPFSYVGARRLYGISVGKSRKSGK
jgi:hypothetical protein